MLFQSSPKKKRKRVSMIFLTSKIFPGNELCDFQLLKFVPTIPSILLSSGGSGPVKFEFRLRGFGSSSLSFSKYSRPTLMADSTCRVSPQLGENDADGKSVETYDRRYAEIVVIRHGETWWNADGRIQGHLDVELNDVGRKQALAVAERLSKETKISAVYSSDLKRASETAEIISRCCGGLQVIKDPDLRERHLGDMQGLVIAEAVKLKPKAYQAFTSSRKDEEIPGGGESLDQLFKRCTTALQRIANKHQGERIVVVTHGGVIRTLHRRVKSQGRSAGKILNASVNIFHLSSSDDKDKWSIEVWGDVSHLNQNQTSFLESGFGGDQNSG